jgi:hypothetical protein
MRCAKGRGIFKHHKIAIQVQIEREDNKPIKLLAVCVGGGSDVTSTMDDFRKAGKWKA